MKIVFLKLFPTGLKSIGLVPAIPLTVFLMLCLGSCAEPPVSHTKLVGGRPVLGGHLNSALIWSDDDSELADSYCTGVKITAKAILTAAHCVLTQTPSKIHIYDGPWSRVPAIAPGKKLKVSFSKVIDESAVVELLTIKKIHIPPQAEECLKEDAAQNEVCNWRTPLPDVAVIELTNLAKTKFQKAPTAKISYRVVMPGTTILMAGYGSHVDSEEDSSDVGIKLRSAPNVVATQAELLDALKGTESEEEETGEFPGWDDSFGAIGTFPRRNKKLPNLGNGDSGGPVFLRDGFTVVGINSDGHCPTGKPGCQRTSQSIFARIDKTSGYAVGLWLEPLLRKLK